MKENPINEILKTSLENMSTLTNVNKIVGDPMLLPNDMIAIPISKVVCGYGVGGSEYQNSKVEASSEIYPFGGGSGGGLTISPIALLIIKDDKIKVVNVEKENDILIKVADVIKDIIKK